MPIQTISRKYRSVGNICLAILPLLLILACATAGTDFRVEALSKLKPTETTEEEAIALLGNKPYQRIQNADGSSLLVWSHASVSPGNVRTKAVSIMFDEAGVMVRFHRGVNVTLPKAEPTSTRRLGIICNYPLPNGDMLPQITSIQKGSLAETAGWKIRDLIIAVDGDPVSTLTDVILATQRGDPVKIYTLRRGERLIDSHIKFIGAEQ